MIDRHDKAGVVGDDQHGHVQLQRANMHMFVVYMKRITTGTKIQCVPRSRSQCWGWRLHMIFAALVTVYGEAGTF